jgi:hypothetical protein
VVGAAIAILLAVAAVAGHAALVPAGSGDGVRGGVQTANIWVDQSGGTCLDSATAVAYDDAAACSWDQMNHTCDNGDTVRVKGGANYGNVTLSGSNGRTAACTIRNADGEDVVMGDLDNGRYTGGDTGADWLRVVGEKSCRYGSGACSFKSTAMTNDFTANNSYDGWDVDAGGAGGARGNTTQPFHMEGGGAATFKNMRVHNSWNASSMMFISGAGPWLMEDLDIYEALNNTSGAIHDECVYATSVTNITWRRVHVWSCTTQSLFVTGAGDATNWLIENSIIESPLGPNNSGLVFRGPIAPAPKPDGLTIRNSTILSMTLPQAPTANGMVVENSYFRQDMPCGFPNSTFRYDVSPTGEEGCGKGSRQFSLASIDAGFERPREFDGTWRETTARPPGNYGLKARSPLRDAAQKTSAPAVDFAGTSRPCGSAPDVGAFEAC